MSEYLGRIRRVHTGWRAIPGKNLLIFDDAVVEVRASAFDGMPVAAGPFGLGGVAIAALRTAGKRRNVPLDQMGPRDLAGLHPGNWMLQAAEITACSLRKRRAGLDMLRRLTFETPEGPKTVDYEPRPSPDEQVAEAMRRALGDKFTMAIKVLRAR